MQEVKLFRKNSIGIGTWRVWSTVETATRGFVHIGHSTVEGGAEICHIDPVVTNNSGRNIEQQIMLEMNARISRQKDKGYKTSREEALLGSTNQLGLVNPMLAQKVQDVTLGQSHFANAYAQPKFDGHRCLITKQGGEMLAYTRKGKPITTIGHILEDAFQWMQDGDTIDGELYIHGANLQSISSYIKRDQAESRKLCYHWYDMVIRNRTFHERYQLMSELAASIRTPQILLVPTDRVYSMSEVYDLFKKYRAAGYEGAMLRLSTHGYQDAVRSASLLKVKERHDDEVTVISMRPSSQGWAILRVKFGDKIEFDISAPGSVEEKTEVLRNESKYIGRKLTIEYANLTTDGVPFHAVAMRWHEEI